MKCRHSIKGRIHFRCSSIQWYDKIKWSFIEIFIPQFIVIKTIYSHFLIKIYQFQINYAWSNPREWKQNFIIMHPLLYCEIHSIFLSIRFILNIISSIHFYLLSSWKRMTTSGTNQQLFMSGWRSTSLEHKISICQTWI